MKHNSTGMRNLRTTSILTVVALFMTATVAVAPRAMAGGSEPTANPIVVKGGVLETIHVDVSRYVTGDEVKVTAVDYDGVPPTIQLTELSVDPDGRGITIGLPAWPSDAFQTTGLSWLLRYLVENVDGTQASAEIRVEIPRETRCDDEISTTPQAMSEVGARIASVIDFAALCSFDETHYGEELAVGQNATIEVASVSEMGATLRKENGQTAWSYLPKDTAISGADWVDFTITDSLGRKASSRALVFVRGERPLVDIYEKGAATATPERSAGTVVTNAFAGLDWARGMGSGYLPASRVVIDTPANHGSTVVNADGTIVYQAEAGWIGQDAYGFRVIYDGLFNGTVIREGTVTVDIVQAPSATTRISVKARSGAPTYVNILQADGVVEVAAISAARHGASTLHGSGSMQYISEPNYSGRDQVVATVRDSLGQTGEVIVDIDVSSAISAANVSVRGPQGKPIVTPVKAVAFGDYKKVTARNVKNGKVEVSGKFLIYTPNPNFIGLTSYEVVVADEFGAMKTATVSVQVLAKLEGLNVWVTTTSDTSVEVTV